MTVRLLLWGRDLDELLTRLYLAGKFLPAACDELAGVLYAKELLAWECLHALLESSDAEWATSRAVLEKRAEDLQSVFGRVRAVLGAELIADNAPFAGANAHGIL